MFNKKVLAMATAALNKAKAPAKKKDIIVDPKGQWKHPGEVTRIPGNDITMQGVPYPVYGIDNTGFAQMMYPGQDYTFPGDYVDEYPMLQKGGVKPYLTSDRDLYNYRKAAYDDSLYMYQQNNSIKLPSAPKLLYSPTPQFPKGIRRGPVKVAKDPIRKIKTENELKTALYFSKVFPGESPAFQNYEKKTGKLLPMNLPMWIEEQTAFYYPHYQYNNANPMGKGYILPGEDYKKVYQHRGIWKKPVQPVYFKDPNAKTETEEESKADWSKSSYEKKHPPIFVTDPNDPRIGSYTEAGNQYLYKPVAPKTNPQLDIISMPIRPLVTMERPSPEIIPTEKKKPQGTIVSPASATQWRQNPATGTWYQIERPVNPEYAPEYSPATGSYKKATGGEPGCPEGYTYNPATKKCRPNNTGNVRYVQDPNDPMYKEYLIRKALYDRSVKDTEWEKEAIRRGWINPEENLIQRWNEAEHYYRNYETGVLEPDEFDFGPVESIAHKKEGKYKTMQELAESCPGCTGAKPLVQDDYMFKSNFSGPDYYNGFNLTNADDFLKTIPGYSFAVIKDPYGVTDELELAKKYKGKVRDYFFDYEISPEQKDNLRFIAYDYPEPEYQVRVGAPEEIEPEGLKIPQTKDVPRTTRVPVQSTETYYVQAYPGGPQVPRQRPVTTYEEVPWTDERAAEAKEYDINTGSYKNKKGGSTKSRKYSRSIEATNKLFHESKLTKKQKSKKKKIYDPYAKYFQVGGAGNTQKYNEYNQNVRYEQIYTPLEEKILGSDYITNYWDTYPTANTDFVAALLIGPDKSRNIPPQTPVIKEIQQKILSLSDKELSKLMNTDWSSGKMSTIIKNLPSNVSAIDAYKYYKHLNYLKNKGYTFQVGGIPNEPDGGYIELELTPEEIEEYKKGGYVVEELPKDGGLTQAQKGITIADPKEYKYRKAMYDDSLKLYNKSIDDLKGMSNTKFIKAGKYTNETPQAGWSQGYINIKKDDLGNTVKGKIKPVGVNYSTRNSDNEDVVSYMYKKPVQPVFFKKEPSIPVLKTLPLKTLDTNRGTAEILPQQKYSKTKKEGVVLPDSREQWKQNPATGTWYRIERPVDPRLSPTYNPGTGSYQKGGFQDDIDKRHNLIRDWTYATDLGLTQEQDGGTYDIGDEVDEETMLKLKALGYKFE
jgi:hypothetical protein